LKRAAGSEGGRKKKKVELTIAAFIKLRKISARLRKGK